MNDDLEPLRQEIARKALLIWAGVKLVKKRKGYVKRGPIKRKAVFRTLANQPSRTSAEHDSIVNGYENPEHIDNATVPIEEISYNSLVTVLRLMDFARSQTPKNGKHSRAAFEPSKSDFPHSDKFSCFDFSNRYHKGH